MPRFPPSRILVERRLNDATTTVAILLWRGEVIASPFRSRIARKSSILDRAFESRLVSLKRSLSLSLPLFFLFSILTRRDDRLASTTLPNKFKMVIFGRSCPWERRPGTWRYTRRKSFKPKWDNSLTVRYRYQEIDCLLWTA